MLMNKISKYALFLFFLIAVLYQHPAFAQAQSKKRESSRRETERRKMHLRDSALRSINKGDTSINGLLQRVEQYATTFNQINNSLSQGLDTVEISQQLQPVIRRIDKINKLFNAHRSSSLRYLFVINDNLDRIQDDLDGWQSDLADIGTKLIQNQKDLLKFTKDTLLKIAPSDSVVRKTFFTQRRAVRLLWSKTDSINRSDLMKLNLLQDKIAVSYTKTLDESDRIDAKIKNFAMKAVSGESDYIWNTGIDYDSFRSALNSTVKLNMLLFDYFSKSQVSTHCIGLLFLVLIFSWILYTRRKTARIGEQPFEHATYIYRKPVASALLVVTAIVPFFYNNPPEVFLEIFFLVSIICTLILVKKESPSALIKFLTLLLILAVVYAVSNLFIEIANIDRYVILLLSIISIPAGYSLHKKVKARPDGHFPYTSLILKIFIFLQILSLLLNISGRFSLAKIIGITAVFNLWQLLTFYIVVQIIIEGLYLQFQLKKGTQSIVNWIDFNLVQKKVGNALLFIVSLLWIFVLLQNLNLDDWANDYVTDVLNQKNMVGGASFTFGGFMEFVVVIWLSSIVSRVVSYLFDVSAQRVNDLSAAKKRNRTSTLIIRMGVFSAGFLLAVFASGFPLDKLTIIISAFGVGIGFGLQNIVNNLVSGLILAFEKPIQIGDIIEVDGATGTMTAIGIRSSKVLTGDGSEIIIPNGDLISHHVINWTLSNTNRQVSLIIHTAYGVDIDKIKELLKTLLTRRDDIMTTPSPSVFVNNVTESFVEFKAFFWVDDISTMSELKSRVLTDIYRELINQKVDMPAPQKDFYLHFPDGNPILVSDTKAKEDKGAGTAKKSPNKTPPDQAP
jgi:small-conductance mechanosensitive channel